MDNKYTKTLKRAKTQPNTTICRRIKLTEYEQFCEWSALPFIARKRMGLPTQKEFGKKYGVNNQTLTVWKHRADFIIKKDSHMHNWMQELSPNVFLALYKKSIKQEWDNPKYLELWLKYVVGWDSKISHQENEAVSKVNLQDLDFLIRVLPLEKQQKFYSTIRELVDDANKIISAKSS